MPVVSIFSGVFCLGREVAEAVASELHCPLLGDAALLSQVSRQFKVPEAKLAKAMYDKPSVFNQFSHERERALAWLKAGMAQVLAQSLAQDDLVYLGYGTHLIPKSISHVLSVCLIADLRSRLTRAHEIEGISEKEATARIHREDQTAQRWVEMVTGGEVWSGKHYDILLPMDKQDPAQAARLIVGHARAAALTPTSDSRQAVTDFALAAEVEAALAAQGHNTRDLSLCASRGRVEIKVNKKVMMLSRLEEELKRLAGQVPGVSGVGVEPGPGYYQADVYRRADFELPSKVLLVDDEQEFVQTLSERLYMREIGSAVVYDGEQALTLVKEDEPEVIVLDLRMPGIDGIEVLKRLKREHPAVEVIILTGHGSDKDRDTCLELGAFAYLEKPVDLDVLHQTMREAYDKIRASQD
jgi:CheY-like chemotaxis protein